MTVDPVSYVREQLAIILGRPMEVTDDLVARWWPLLARVEEHDGLRDRHGNYPAEASRLAQLHLLEDPPLHADIAALAADTPVVPRWPGDKRFAACLTHDVDRIVLLPWQARARQVRHFRTASLSQRLRWAAASALYATGALVGLSDLAVFDPWLALEGAHGFHSTFFLLPAALPRPAVYDHPYRYDDAVRLHGRRMPLRAAAQAVQAAGWEIGLHGSYSSGEEAALLQEEKAQLEAMLGAPVVSTRQHFLRFNATMTPHWHAAAGFQADSTLGYSSTIGCRAGLAFPYFWPGEDDLLQVPLVIQDIGLLRVQGQAVEIPREITRARELITRIAEVGGAVTLSWHSFPNSPGAMPVYEALLETIADLGGWGCSLGELNTWWRARRTQVREMMRQEVVRE